MSDEQIKKDIADHLYWDQSVASSDITVEVSEGHVRLKGTTPSCNARRAANTDAVKIPGVISVKNDLLVKAPPEVSIPTDKEIKRRIHNVILYNAVVDPSMIKISVHKGQVTLEGVVDAYFKKVRIEEVVSMIEGVFCIENAITVVPTEKHTDEVIARDIESALKRRSDIDVNKLNVCVENGAVTLSGMVPNRATRDEVESIARHTAGVVNVIDKLGWLYSATWMSGVKGEING